VNASATATDPSTVVSTNWRGVPNTGTPNTQTIAKNGRTTRSAPSPEGSGATRKYLVVAAERNFATAVAGANCPAERAASSEFLRNSSSLAALRGYRLNGRMQQ
jgi:hypothetical protein